MKESVTKFNLEAAFKALDEIEIPVARKGIAANKVNLKETFTRKSKLDLLMEDYYDVNDTEELEAAKEAREAEVAKAKLARIEKIVDLNAESEEDLLPTYVGKVIIQCPQCMTLFYKDQEDVSKSEDDPEIVNINEVCQHCGNASGYTLVGKVDQVGEEEAEEYDLDAFEDENELNLDFPEGTEEVDPEGTGEDARDDEELDLEPVNVDEEETTEEESDEEEVKESLHEDFDEEFLDEEEEEVEISEDELEDEELEETEEESEEVVDEEEKVVVSAEEIKEIAAEAGEEVAEVVKENPEVEVEEIKEITDEVVETALDVEDETEEEVVEDEISEEEVVEDEEVMEESLTEAEDCKIIFYCCSKDNKHYTIEKSNLKPTEIRAEVNKLAKDGSVKNVYVAKVVGGKEIPLDKFTYDPELTPGTPEYAARNKYVDEALTEAVDKELDDKLKAHNEYIEYLKKMIQAEEESLGKAKNEFVKKSIQSRIDALKADLEAALPEALKDEVVADELPTPEESGLEDAAENKEEVKDEDVKESLNETYYACAEIDGEERRFPFNSREEAKKYIDTIQKGEAKEFEGKKIGSTWTEDLKEETKESLTEDVIVNINVEGEKEEAPVIIPVEANVETGCLPEAECPVEPIVEPEPFVEPTPEVAEPEVAEEPAVEVEDEEVEISEEELEDEEIKDEEVIEEACEPLTEENFDLTDAEMEELFNSDEFKKPISDAEVRGYLGEEKAVEEIFETIDELDDESIQNCICESLTEVYSNVENFVMESCEMNNGAFKINGTINFKSGNTSKTSYVFTEAKHTNNKLVLRGINETLSTDGNFTLETTIDSTTKTMIAEALSYSYKINNNLVEGLIKNNK